MGQILHMRIPCCALLLVSSLAGAEVVSLPILPSATDAHIQNLDGSHWMYIDRDIIVDHKPSLPQDRHELLLWLTGTGGKGHDAQGFANLAAELGYHVLSVMYPDDIPATACANDTDPRSFEDFRMAIIAGGQAKYQAGRKSLTITREDSIEYRLAKLLERLQSSSQGELEPIPEF